MKAVQAEFQENPRKIRIKPDAREDSWPDVCRRFNDDVERVCDVQDIPGYTGLYKCLDGKNQAFYYLVEEGRDLFRMKRRHFRDNIGLK